MQSRFGRVVMSTVVCAALPLVAAASVALASTPPGSTVSLPPVVVMATPAVKHKAPPHPEINAAIRSLERAKAHLQEAAHDFNGHRADALAAVDAALRQLRIIVEYDK
jgi:hypothetical protein